jgi:hypothetical protein
MGSCLDVFVRRGLSVTGGLFHFAQSNDVYIKRREAR